MSLSPIQLAGIVPIMAASAFLQGTIGFAFGLFCVPAMMMLGLKLHEAIAISAAGTLVQSAWATFHLREHIAWRTIAPSIIVRGVFMLAGIGILAHGLAPRPILAKQLLGIVLLTFVAILWLFRVQPRDRLHLAWSAVAFPSSGLMGGLFGMGGPPLVLWAMAHRWPNQRTRGFLIVNFFAAAPIQMLVMWLTFRGDIAWLMLIGLAFGPVVILGTHAGLWAGHKLSERRLRMCAFGVLVIMAISAIAGPYLPNPRQMLRPAAQAGSP